MSLRSFISTIAENGAAFDPLGQVAPVLRSRLAEPGNFFDKDIEVAVIDGPISLFDEVIEQRRKEFIQQNALQVSNLDV